MSLHSIADLTQRRRVRDALDRIAKSYLALDGEDLRDLADHLTKDADGLEAALRAEKADA